jgi:hypothetical protein
VQECAGEYIPDYETNLCSEHSHLICEHVGNINTFESFLITSTCYIVCLQIFRFLLQQRVHQHMGQSLSQSF